MVILSHDYITTAQTVEPLSSQQQIVDIPASQRTQDFLRLGGFAVGIGGTIAGTVLGIQDTKEKQYQRQRHQTKFDRTDTDRNSDRRSGEPTQPEPTRSPTHAQTNANASRKIQKNTQPTNDLSSKRDRDFSNNSPNINESISDRSEPLFIKYQHDNYAEPEPDRDRGQNINSTNSRSASRYSPPESTFSTDYLKYADPNICRAIASSDKSLFVCSTPGSGKSTTIKASILEVLKIYPSAEFHIVDRKNRPWMGLEKVPGLVAVPKKRDYTPLLKKVEYVSERLDYRRSLSPEEVEKLHPLILIVDDYHSLRSNFKNYLTAKQTGIVEGDLNEIITDGREFKVMVWIISQSPNATDLGFSAAIKKGAGIFVLGRININPDTGEEDGGYSAIWDIITKDYTISSEQIRKSLQQLMPEIQVASTNTGRPAFFTTMGRYRLGLMPDLNDIKHCLITVKDRPPVTEDPILKELKQLKENLFPDGIDVEDDDKDVWS